MNLGCGGFNGVVYDSGESLLIFELSSQTNTPLPSALLQTRMSNSQHQFVLCTSTSCDILHEVFSGNAAKASVFDVLDWWLYPNHSLFPIYRARAVYEHWTVFLAHTQNGKRVDCEEIFSESDKKSFGL